MNPFFKIINIFLSQKFIFSKKNFEKLNIFYKNFWFFSKSYFNTFNFSGGTYKSREISDEFYYLVGNFIKKLKNGLNGEGLLEMGWKFLKFLQKIDWNLYKMEDHQHFKNDLHRTRNLRNLRAQLCAFWNISRKFWYFLIKISMGNGHFHKFLLNISWSCASRPKVYIPGR